MTWIKEQPHINGAVFRKVVVGMTSLNMKKIQKHVIKSARANANDTIMGYFV